MREVLSRGGGTGGYGILSRLEDQGRLQVIPGFPDSSVDKESACNAGDTGFIPRSGRSAGEGIGHPLQYSGASLAAQLVKKPPAMQ